jgi:hypothetical protein
MNTSQKIEMILNDVFILLNLNIKKSIMSSSTSTTESTTMCHPSFNLTPRFNLPRFNLPRLTASKMVALYYETLKRSRSTHDDRIHYFLDLCASSVHVELHVFTERALEHIFLSIQTLENEEMTYNQNEEKCMRHYGLTQAEVMRLFFALRNYHLLYSSWNSFKLIVPSGLYLFCDVSDDDAECNRCGFISKAETEDEADEADEADAKMIFYYSTEDGPNVPVCTECYWSTQTPAVAEVAREAALESEEAELAEAEVEEEQLETCVNCGRVWDGYAQCTCWGLSYINNIEEEEEGLIKPIINPLYTIYKNIPIPIPIPAAAAAIYNNNNNYVNLSI